MEKIKYGLIAIIGMLVFSVLIVSNSKSDEMYNGALEDLFIDENELPEGFSAWEPSNEDWTFVPAYETSIVGWEFVPAEEGIDDPLNTYMPREYEAVMFVNADEDGDPKEALVQIVLRYSADDIDSMFDTGDWTFVPAPGIDDAIGDDGVRAKVSFYNETGARKNLTMQFTKKDILVVLSYVSYTDFDYDLVFENACEVVQRI